MAGTKKENIWIILCPGKIQNYDYAIKICQGKPSWII